MFLQPAKDLVFFTPLLSCPFVSRSMLSNVRLTLAMPGHNHSAGGLTNRKQASVDSFVSPYFPFCAYVLSYFFMCVFMCVFVRTLFIPFL